MSRQWIAFEHYRLHTIERWPDSPRKTAGLAAVRATLRSFGSAAEEFECCQCARRRIINMPVHAPAKQAA